MTYEDILDSLPRAHFKVVMSFKKEIGPRVYYVKAKHHADALIKAFGYLTKDDMTNKLPRTITSMVDEEEVKAA